jgi:DNA polymerase V
MWIDGMTRLIQQLIPCAEPVQLQSFAGVPCGWPSPAADYEEAPLSLDDLVSVSAYSTFLVRAKGDSMYPLIRDGDVLVVDRSLNAERGDVVVAMIGGDFTVKRLGRIEGRDALIPENSNMAPIFILKDEGVEIWGVVAWNLHRLKRARQS